MFAVVQNGEIRQIIQPHVAFTIGETIETMWLATSACVPAHKWRETLGLSWVPDKWGQGKWVFSDPAKTFSEVVGA